MVGQIMRAFETLGNKKGMLEAKIEAMPKIFGKAFIEQLKTLSFRVTDSSPLGYLNVAEQRTVEVLRAMQNRVNPEEVAGITGGCSRY